MLALFPLSLVLFPETVIQLHIFEPKYKNMINYCLEMNMEFGLSPVISAKIQTIGCSARILEIIKKYPNGNMDILIRGMRKYILKESKLSESDYTLGNVEFIEERTNYPDPDLLDKCIELYNTITDELTNLNLEKVNVSMFYSQTPSYFFVQKGGFSLKQKYDILQLDDENLRLEYILHHFEEIGPMIHQAEIIQRLIKNDGYAKQ